MQTSSTLMSMETGMKLIVLKRHKKIKRHKKLSSMSPKPLTLPTILWVAKIPESRNLNRKPNISNLFLKWVQMGLSWLMRYKLHYSFIQCLQLCKYNLKRDFSWNGQISIKEWKKQKKKQKKMGKRWRISKCSWTHFLNWHFARKYMKNM